MPNQAFSLNNAEPISVEGSDSKSSPEAGISQFSQKPPRWSGDLWHPYLRKTALRVFASCGLSAQVCLSILDHNHDHSVTLNGINVEYNGPSKKAPKLDNSDWPMSSIKIKADFLLILN